MFMLHGCFSPSVRATPEVTGEAWVMDCGFGLLARLTADSRQQESLRSVQRCRHPNTDWCSDYEAF